MSDATDNRFYREPPTDPGWPPCVGDWYSDSRGDTWQCEPSGKMVRNPLVLDPDEMRSRFGPLRLHYSPARAREGRGALCATVDLDPERRARRQVQSGDETAKWLGMPDVPNTRDGAQ